MESQKWQTLKLKLIHWTILLTSIILGVTFIMSIYFSAQIGATNGSNNLPNAMKGHYSALLIGNETTFNAALMDGMSQEAIKREIALEFHIVNDVDQATEIVKMLVRAGVDGIITQGINNPSFLTALKSVTQDKIPLVLLYTDLSTAERDAFVGVNPFEMGNTVANLLVSAKPDEGNIVFISQSSVEVNENSASKMHVLGFLDGLEGYINPEKVLFKTSQPTLLSAEGLVSELFAENQGITAIVCTNETDTIGVAQVVVDLNRVGKTVIIGTGFTEEIAEYIDKGIVYGTVHRNPIEMGTNVISTLTNLPNAETHTEMPIEVITKDNIDLYRYLIGGNP